MEGFSQYVRNIAVFLIFTSFAGIMITNIKYKGFINLTLGFVMIFIIIGPVRDIFFSSDDIGAVIENFAEQLNVGSLQYENIINDNSQNELILSTYEESLKTRLEILVNDNSEFKYEDCDIDIDNSEEGFGSIKAVYLEVSEEQTPPPEPAKKALIRIEPVEINTNSIFSTKYDPDALDEESEETKNIKYLISDFYNLSHDNIYITVQRKN